MSEVNGDSLFSDVEGLTRQDEVIDSRRTVRIDRDLLDRTRFEITHRRTSEALQLDLPDDLSYESIFTRIGDTSTGYWIAGYIDSVPLSAVTLVVNEKAIAGTIRTPTKAFLIRSVGKSIYVIEEVDQPTINENERVYTPDLSVQPSRPPSLPMDETELDDNVIDVFVVYTREARESLGGLHRTRAQIDLAVAETNVAYEIGGTEQRIRLVGAVETDYRETSDDFADFDRFYQTDDGYMDEIHALRDAYAADLMHLVRDCCSAAGWVAPYDDTRAFAFTGLKSTDRSKFLSSDDFAHELGHNMGLQHDRYVYAGNDPFPYSHGYVNQAAFEENAPEDACWTTIMAYPRQCRHAGLRSFPLMRFSNPNQRYPDEDGEHLGVPGEQESSEVDGPADAIRSLNETYASVANFRNSRNRCTYTVSPKLVTVAAVGGSFDVSVSVEGTNCPDQPNLHDDFLTLDANETAGSFRFRFESNQEAARFGTVTIAAETIEVRQKGSREPADVCGRSSWMQNAIVTYTGREDCDDVTEFDLATFYELSLSGSDLGGPMLPIDFDSLSSLISLDLSGNRLSGEIPDTLATLTNLQYLNLSDNQLDGAIPTSLGDLSKLETLDLSKNELTGRIPSELGKLERLGTLFVDNNGLTESIPSSFRNLLRLSQLLASDNELSGEIPSSIGQLNGLVTLALQRNRLSGHIPVQLGNLESVAELFLEDNELSGQIPRSLADLERLALLGLSGNALVGCVPPSLRELTETDVDLLELPDCTDDDHGDTGDDATQLGALPASTIGYLERDTDRDVFQVDLEASGMLRIFTSGRTDTSGALTDADGAAIAQDDDGGDERNFRIVRELQAGTYYIEVSGFSGVTGGYELEASVVQ